MKTFEAVIFDCDGVVVDSTQLQKNAEQQTAAEFAELHSLSYKPEEVDWGSMQGWGRKKIATKIFGIEVDSEIADAYRTSVVEKTVEIADQESLSLIPGITNFVNYLTIRGLRKGLATSINRKIYSRYCALNQMDFFHPDYIVAHQECIDDKPKPGQYYEVMRRMDVDPSRTLVIEDSGSGITAGRHAGAVVLGIATTHTPEYLRTKTGAHLVATDFNDAARVLQPYLPK